MLCSRPLDLHPMYPKLLTLCRAQAQLPARLASVVKHVRPPQEN